MANAFDSANYPTTEPAELRVGDRWAWKRTDLTDYPVAAYSLKYSLRLEGTGSTEIEITAGESGSEYVVEVASATTSAYSAGWYRWAAYIIRTADNERVQVGTGRIHVVPNYDASTVDPRSHARVMLSKIESILENRAASDVDNYSIAGRSISKMRIEELIKWRDYYRTEAAREANAENIARGLGAAKVRVRF